MTPCDRGRIRGLRGGPRGPERDPVRNEATDMGRSPSGGAAGEGTNGRGCDAARLVMVEPGVLSPLVGVG